MFPHLALVQMTASELITTDIVPLRTSESGDDALEMMHEFYVQHLPIVNDRELLGLISEDDILENDVTEPIGSYQLSQPYTRVRSSDHLYEVMRVVAEFDLTAVPVVDAEGSYLGLITALDLLNYYARTSTFTETGSIILLEIQRRDYSLSEIARIAESENGIILSSFVEAVSEGSLLLVTIKVNLQHVQGIIATFERFGYKVSGTFNEVNAVDTLKERYDALINYLNV